jgi:hypothetical protein
VAKIWFAVSAISAIDALTSVTGWINIAHHDRAHAAFVLGRAVVCAIFGVYLMRRPPAF